MPQLTINLTSDEMEQLQQQAATTGQSAADLASVLLRGSLACTRLDDAAWRAQLGAALAALHQCLPPAITAEETEADITAAAAEVKEARRAARGA